MMKAALNMCNLAEKTGYIRVTQRPQSKPSKGSYIVVLQACKHYEGLSGHEVL